MSLVAFWPLAEPFERISTAGTSADTAVMRSVGLRSLLIAPGTTTATGYMGYAGLSATTGAQSNLNIGDAWCTFYVRFNTLPGSGAEPFFRMVNGASTNKLEARITSGGKIAIYNAAGTLVSTGATTLVAGTIYRIGIRGGNGTSANYAVKVALETDAFGGNELSGTGDFGATNVDQIWLGKYVNRSSQQISYTFQDLIIDNAAFWDNYNIGIALPTGAGTDSQWAGTFANVDELPCDQNTTVVTSANANEVVTFAMHDFSAIGGTGTDIRAVMATNIKVRIVTSDPNRVRVRSGATVNETSNLNTGASYTLVGKLYLTDPNTSASWTTSAIDALQVGANDQGINGSRMSQCAAYVLFVPPIVLGGPLIPVLRHHYLMQGIC